MVDIALFAHFYFFFLLMAVIVVVAAIGHTDDLSTVNGSWDGWKEREDNW